MRVPLACLLPWLLVAACAAPEPAPAPAVAASGGPSSSAASAAPSTAASPDINAEFRKPDLDVPSWVARFEGESREIAVHRDQLAAVLDLHPGEAVADIGAGTGLFEEPFAKAVGTSGTVYAVDISPAFIEHIKQRAADAGWTQVHTVLCDDHDTKLAPGSVDAAFICDTYHHFEYPAETLASLKSALRPGGRLVIVDFKRIPGQSRDWILQHVRCGEDQVRAEVEAAGFRFVRAAQVAGLGENYVIEFTAPGKLVSAAEAPNEPAAPEAPALDADSFAHKSTSEIEALAASPDPQVRLAVIRNSVGFIRDFLANRDGDFDFAATGDESPDPAGEPAATAEAEDDDGDAPAKLDRSRVLGFWGIGLPSVLTAVQPTLASGDWTDVDADIANAFAEYISVLPDAPEFAFTHSDPAGNREEAERLGEWLETQFSDPHFRAYLIFTFDGGPYFPEVTDGGDPLAFDAAADGPDGLRILAGFVTPDPADAPRMTLQGTRDGHVLWTARLDEGEGDASPLQIEQDEPWGWVLRVGGGHSTTVHLDPAGRPEFFFVHD